MSPAPVSLAARSAAALLACSAFACFGFQGRIDELRGRLVGVDARTLRGCVGVPTTVDVVGDQEVHTYRFSDDGAPIDRIPTGLPPAERIRERDRTGREDLGYCELTFRLREGRVQDVSVKGRRASGLNDDAGCLKRTESCSAPVSQK